ncbi:hypothetical protein ES703_81791 [subsurface metagenome]
MTEDEIRKIVHEECAEIIRDSQLTESDIIVKKDAPITKSEIVQNQITTLTILKKKIGDFLVLLAKRGCKVVKIIIITFGLWEVTQSGAMLLFEKSLPDALQLAQNVRNAGENFLVSQTRKVTNEAEAFIVVSDSWKNLSPEEYRVTVYDCLSSDDPIQKLQADVFEAMPSNLIPYSSVPAKYTSTSANPADFTVGTV